MKHCTKCNTDLDLASFSRDKNRRDGLSPWCRACCRESNRKWREANADLVAAKELAYRQANREAARVRAREWAAANPERVRESKKARAQETVAERAAYQREWYINNADAARKRAQEWKRANRDRARLSSRLAQQRRNARKRQATVFAISAKDLRALLSAPCRVTGCTNTDMQMDHVIPIARGGSHGIGNLAPLCGTHNNMKNDRTWIEFRAYLALRERLAA